MEDSQEKNITHQARGGNRASLGKELSCAGPHGLFVTFEGGEGAGKTTHITFLADVLRGHGREVVCLREPGGTPVGEQLRRIVLDPQNDEICDECELFLYEAARAQLVSRVVAPALARGAVVLCDRFADSSVAYQSFGRGLDRAFVEGANAFACQGIQPDCTILLKTGGDSAVGLARATHRCGADRLERAGDGFHERVNAGFDLIAQQDPERIKTVVSADKKSQTARAIFEALAGVIPWLADGTVPAEAFDRLDAPRAHGAADSRV